MKPKREPMATLGNKVFVVPASAKATLARAMDPKDPAGKRKRINPTR